jgi:hypothetical protein
MNKHPISNHLPPMVRDALVSAGQARDYDLIDEITDKAAKTYPELVHERRVCRPEFAPLPRVR